MRVQPLSALVLVIGLAGGNAASAAPDDGSAQAEGGFWSKVELGGGPAMDLVVVRGRGLSPYGLLASAAWVPRPWGQLDLDAWHYGWPRGDFYSRTGLSLSGRASVVAGGRPICFFGVGGDLWHGRFHYAQQQSYGYVEDHDFVGFGSAVHGMFGLRLAQEPHFFLDLELKVRRMWVTSVVEDYGATLALVGGWRGRP